MNLGYGRFTSVSRAYVSAWARKALSHPKLVILDTETTGQSWHHDEVDEIVEICLINQRGEALLNTLVRPQGAIHPGATRVNHITDEMVATAPTFDALAEALANLLRDSGLVIYNAKYDHPLLQFEFTRCGLDFPPCDVRCAMLVYAAWRQIPGRSYGHYHYHSLQNACAHEGIVPHMKAHRALADCLATLDLLRRMAK